MGSVRIVAEGDAAAGDLSLSYGPVPTGAADTHDPRRVTVLQEWEGLVEDLGPETMSVRLTDVTCPSHDDEWCEIPLARVPTDLMCEVGCGTTFRMLVVREHGSATSVVLAPLVGPRTPEDAGAKLADTLLTLVTLAARAGPREKGSGTSGIVASVEDLLGRRG